MGGFIVLGVFLVGLERILSWMRSRLSQVGVLFVTMSERAETMILRCGKRDSGDILEKHF